MLAKFTAYTITILTSLHSFAEPIYTWNGAASDGDWNNSANWDANRIPEDKDASYPGLNGEMLLIFNGTGPSINVPMLRAYVGAPDGSQDFPRIWIKQGSTELEIFRDAFWKRSKIAINPHFHMIKIGTGSEAATLIVHSDVNFMNLSRFEGEKKPTAFLISIENKGTLHFKVPELRLCKKEDHDMQILLKSGAKMVSEQLSIDPMYLGSSETYIYLQNNATYTFKKGTGLNTPTEVASYFDTLFRTDPGEELRVTEHGDHFTITAKTGQLKTLHLIIAAQ